MAVKEEEVEEMGEDLAEEKEDVGGGLGMRRRRWTRWRRWGRTRGGGEEENGGGDGGGEGYVNGWRWGWRRGRHSRRGRFNNHDYAET